MLVNTAKHTYVVKFVMYDYTTRCLIHDVKDAKTVIEGKVTYDPRDEYDLYEGKKRSLQKAMRLMKCCDEDCRCFITALNMHCCKQYAAYKRKLHDCVVARKAVYKFVKESVRHHLED